MSTKRKMSFSTRKSDKKERKKIDPDTINDGVETANIKPTVLKADERKVKNQKSKTNKKKRCIK